MLSFMILYTENISLQDCTRFLQIKSHVCIHECDIPGMHLENTYVEGGLNQSIKFQEGQEVSMHSMLNLGGLRHALQEIF